MLPHKAPVHLGTSGAKGWGVSSDGRQRKKTLSSDDVHKNSGCYGNGYYNATQKKAHRNNFCGLSALMQDPSKLLMQSTQTHASGQAHALAHTQTHAHVALLMGLAGARMEMRLGNQSPGRGHS